MTADSLAETRRKGITPWRGRAGLHSRLVSTDQVTPLQAVMYSRVAGRAERDRAEAAALTPEVLKHPN